MTEKQRIKKDKERIERIKRIKAIDTDAFATIKITPAIEKNIKEIILDGGYGSGNYPEQINKKALYAWIINPSLNTEHVISFIKTEIFDYLNNDVFNKMLKSGLYSYEELEGLVEEKGGNFRFYIYAEYVLDPSVPDSKLRALWSECWKDFFSSGEIPEPSWGNFGGRYSKTKPAWVMMTVYNLITGSRLGQEFAVEYMEVHGDDKFISQATKDIFMF